MLGKQPPSDLFLLVIALFKLAKAIFFIFVGVALLHFVHADKEIVIRLQALMGNLHVDEDNHAAKWILEKASQLTKFKIESLSAICFLYAVTDTIEGVGLYLRKRWAEYLVVILTSAFLPLEALTIWHRVTPSKILLMIGNLIIVGYLIYVIRRKDEALDR